MTLPGHDLVALPDGAADAVRQRLTGSDGGPVRISYIPGPGDVVGTHGHWQNGAHDPRVPVITYSAMFYEMTRRLGAQVQVLTPTLPEARRQTGHVLFERLAARTRKDRIGYQLDQNARVREASALVRAFDPHVVLASTDFPFRGWSRLSRGRKLVLSAHNTFWPMGRRPETGTEALKLRLLKQASHALDGAICTSAECARQIEDLTEQRIKGRVQHPQTMRSFDLTEKQQARRLLYLGRIETSKGIFMLLEAYLKTKATCPGLSLKFAGDGSASDRLQSEIAATGDPDVQFLGRLDAEGVHGELAQTDLLICPTTSAFNEGLAMVCLEAAAHGAPTLASSVIPAVDLLGAGCAVFRVDDTADLHRHLQHLVDDDAAFQTLAAATSDVRAGLSDRSRSWGSELCKVLMAL